MNTSSFFSFAQSALFSSALVLTLASCEKENVQPKDSSASTYEAPASIKPKEILMPGVPDHKIVKEDGGLDMKQTGLNESISTDNRGRITMPDADDRFRQIGNNEEVSTQSVGPGTPDRSKFKQVGSGKKYSTLSDEGPGIGTPDLSKFRKSGPAKKNITL